MSHLSQLEMSQSLPLRLSILGCRDGNDGGSHNNEHARGRSAQDDSGRGGPLLGQMSWSGDKLTIGSLRSDGSGHAQFQLLSERLQRDGDTVDARAMTNIG